MKMIKRWMYLLAVMLLVFSLAGCGSKAAGDPMDGAAQWLLQNVKEPTLGPTGGEWTILGLARWEDQIPDGYLDGYYERLSAEVKAMNGILHEKKYTEYSRVIMALTAIGKDPADVAGYDLLSPLADLKQTVFQGVNGASYALLALDSGNYTIPGTTEQESLRLREDYIAWILEKEAPAGGWGFGGSEADGDITAMVLQALAKYRDREDVAQAVERGVACLSELCRSGKIAAKGNSSCESICQTIVALTELGIPMDDVRFTMEGKTLKDALLAYRMEDGGFRHTLQGQKADLMATEQAFYTLVAIRRMEQGKTSLYSMK